MSTDRDPFLFGPPPETGTTPINPTEHTMEQPTDQPTESLNVTADAASAQQTKPARHPARVGTIVWGAVVVVLAVLIIIASRTGLDLDARLTAMWLLLGAGVAMVAGGAIKLLRKTQR